MMTQPTTNYFNMAAVLSHLNKCLLLWSLRLNFEADILPQIEHAIWEIEEALCVRAVVFSSSFLTLSYSN